MIKTDHSPLPYSARDRAQYIALLSIASFVLIVARLLHPSPNGFGTHQQLGLPPCFFLKFTGFPCPACGLTTSFAHTVRFHFQDAFFTQPFGLIACLVTASLIPMCVGLMYNRVPWMKVLTSRVSDVLMYTMIVLFVAGWVYKIFAMR